MRLVGLVLLRMEKEGSGGGGLVLLLCRRGLGGMRLWCGFRDVEKVGGERNRKRLRRREATLLRWVLGSDITGWIDDALFL